MTWNTFQNDSFQPADIVLGQSDFTKAANDDADQDGVPYAGPSAGVVDYLTGVFGYGDLLVVSDCYNDRVLVFRSK